MNVPRRRPGSTFRMPLWLALAMGALLAAPAAELHAQACSTPVCRSGYRLEDYRGRQVCHTGAGWQPQSFYYAPQPICPADADLVGQSCVKKVCCVKAACAPDRRYSDGRCERTGAGGVISFVWATCEAGWDLDRASGQCRMRDCPPAVPPDRQVGVPAPPRTGLPDLVIESFRVSGRGGCRPGSPVVTLEVVVANRGPAAFAGTRSNMVHVIDRHPAGWGAVMVPLDAIPAGGRKTVTVPFFYLTSNPTHMRAGAPHPFRAKVDAWDRLTEIDEGNNESDVLEVGALRDCP